jgi:hypothetical protein
VGVRKLAFILLIIPLSANAVYKCTDANGKAIYSEIPCASDAVKLNVEEPEWRKEQIETNIAVKKLVADAQRRKREKKQKEDERAWRENELLRTQWEIADRQNQILTYRAKFPTQS